MRGRRFAGRMIAGIMAVVVMMTAVPFTTYAEEDKSKAETEELNYSQ